MAAVMNMMQALSMGAVQDQAAGLRRLLAPRAMRVLPLLGATGATHQACTAAALARGLSDVGCRVLIADESHGEVAQDLGLRARFELSHVIGGDKELARVVMAASDSIAVLPAARGLARIGDAATAG